MKRLLAKIGRFFWSRGFLKFVLWTATLIILFYVEEDWRGARAWAATKAEWEAKGVSFDRLAYIPRPIPDDQNLAAIPLFETEISNRKDPAYGEPLALQKALRRGQAGNDLPAMGNVLRGELPDMTAIRLTIAKAYAEAFKDTPPPAASIDQLDALYPFLADLHQASSDRPLCSFKEDYSSPLPAGRPLGLLTGQIQVSRLLTLHAIMALADHQPDLALADLKTNFKLISGLRRDPTLVAGLVAIGVNAIGNGAVAYGLALHAWDDRQLAEIQDELSQIDFLQANRFVLQAEAMTETIPNFDFIMRQRRSMDISGYFKQTPDSATPFVAWITSVWADGWFDQNKAQAVNTLLNSAQTVDPKLRLVYPRQADDLEDRINALKNRWDANAPWNLLFTIEAPPLLGAMPHFAQAQVMVDQARLACALERVRLARGSYPDSLQALAPAAIDEVPNDIMTGHPYLYHLRPDGTFLLYSVGWNQQDDGGHVVYKNAELKQIDFKQGDWVWPTPKAASP